MTRRKTKKTLFSLSNTCPGMQIFLANQNSVSSLIAEGRRKMCNVKIYHVSNAGRSALCDVFVAINFFSKNLFSRLPSVRSATLIGSCHNQTSQTCTKATVNGSGTERDNSILILGEMSSSSKMDWRVFVWMGYKRIFDRNTLI